MLSCHGCCHTKEHIGCSKGVDCPRVNREVIAAHRKSADLKRKRLVEQSQLTSNPLPAEVYRKCKISDKQRYSSKCRVKEQTQPQSFYQFSAEQTLLLTFVLTSYMRKVIQMLVLSTQETWSSETKQLSNQSVSQKQVQQDLRVTLKFGTSNQSK